MARAHDSGEQKTMGKGRGVRWEEGAGGKSSILVENTE